MVKRLSLILIAAITAFSVLPATPASADTQYEEYETGTATSTIYGNIWDGQVFTAESSHTLTAVAIEAIRVGATPKTFNIYLKNASAGYPTGSVLASATGSTSQWDTGSYSWVTWTMNQTTNLVAGQQYAIYWSVPDGTSSYKLTEHGSSVDDYFTGNQLTSTNGGSTWTATFPDRNFKIYGNGIDLPSLADTEISLGSTVTMDSSVVDIGSTNVTAWGFAWGTSAGVYTDNTSESGDTDTPFEFEDTDASFTAGTTYYVASWAQNDTGVAYGEETSFTAAYNPTVITRGTGGNIGTSISLVGQLSDNGSATITRYGTQISLAGAPPSISTEYTDGSIDPGVWVDTHQGLTPGTTYYYRAFVLNSIGYGYGDWTQFVAGGAAPTPTLVTGSATSITASSAVVSATISGSSGSLDLRGFSWGTDNSSLTHSVSDFGTSYGDGQYSITLNGLPGGSTIYYRAMAHNSGGSYSGDIESFNTLSGVPVVSNGSAIVSGTIVTLYGSIDSLPGSTYADRRWFSWTTDPGAATVQSVIDPETGVDQFSTGSWNAVISNLLPNTVYYFKAGAHAAGGNGYAPDWTSFTTGSDSTGVSSVPTVVTGSSTKLSPSVVTIAGSVTLQGSSNVTSYGFNYGTSTAVTSTWIGSGQVEGDYSRNINGIPASYTVLYYRAWAANSFGTGYGDIRSIDLTQAAGTIGGSTPVTTTPQGAAKAVGASLNDVMDIWGLNNYVGRWMAVIVLCVVSYLIFRKNRVWSVLGPLLVFGFGIIQGWIDLTTLIILSIIAAALVWNMVRKKTIGNAND